MSAARLIAAALLAAGLTACQTVDRTRAPLSAAPEAQPIRTRTSFSDAQSCLDRQFSQQPLSKIVAVGNFEDRTKGAAVGGREMIESAVHNVARSSGRWRVRRQTFLDDTLGVNGQLVPSPAASQPAVAKPDYRMVGTLTQLDKGVELESLGGSLVFADLIGLGFHRNQQVSILGIEVQLFDGGSGDLVAQTSNSVVLANIDRSTETRGKIGKLGATFDMSYERQSGFAAAARTLIDLGVIELLGQTGGVPYWECLSLPSTNPEVRALIFQWWRGLSAEAQRSYVRQRLIALGYLASGADEDEMARALARFEASVGLVADGRPDDQVYAALLAGAPSDAQAAAAASSLAPTPPPPPPPAPGQGPPPPRNLEVLFDYDDRTGLLVEARVLQGSYLTCYLQIQTGEIVQVYPNLYQSRRLLPPGRILIPPSPQTFQIRRENRPEPMSVLCFTTGRDVSKELPPALRKAPFQTMPGVSLDDVRNAYRAIPGSSSRGFSYPTS